MSDLNQFWRDAYLAALSAGRSAEMAAKTADESVEKLLARLEYEAAQQGPTRVA